MTLDVGAGATESLVIFCFTRDDYFLHLRHLPTRTASH
jgi:hypothetical protein